MINGRVTPNFWREKKVFLTGHTGFKGGWLSLWLKSMGARVTGYALDPSTQPNLFDVLSIQELCERSYIADIRDIESLRTAMTDASPEILIHMAAQPLVRYSYINPVETYATNVMGTVHVLEIARKIKSLRATVVVTSDKCYENKEWVWGYREFDPIGGYDPYSNSKGCTELVTSSYRQSFFPKEKYATHLNAIASARAGNVIGGGDWSRDRLIPDAIRAFEANQVLMIRNPLAQRPWQHVLEPLSGYLILAEALYLKGMDYASAWNFGPQDCSNRSVQDVIDILIKKWGKNAMSMKVGTEQPYEANLLKLDCSKSRRDLSWVPKWGLETTLEKVIEWQKGFQSKSDMRQISLMQIKQYMDS